MSVTADCLYRLKTGQNVLVIIFRTAGLDMNYTGVYTLRVATQVDPEADVVDADVHGWPVYKQT